MRGRWAERAEEQGETLSFDKRSLRLGSISDRKAELHIGLRSLFASQDATLTIKIAAKILGCTEQVVKHDSRMLGLSWASRSSNIIQKKKSELAKQLGVREDQIHDTERTCRFKLYKPKQVHPLEELATKLNCTRGQIEYQIKKGVRTEEITIKKKREDWGSYASRVTRIGLTKMQGARARRMGIQPEIYLSKLFDLRMARPKAVRKIYRSKRGETPKRKRMNAIRKLTVHFMKKKSNRFNLKYGTTSNAFRAHIERQFTNKMTWANHGKTWHLDHIYPLSKFDLTDRNQLLIACNWQNFQPLLVRDNLNKSDKIKHPQLSLLLQSR